MLGIQDSWEPNESLGIQEFWDPEMRKSSWESISLGNRKAPGNIRFISRL